jgi:hypothetical protein
MYFYKNTSDPANNDSEPQKAQFNKSQTFQTKDEPRSKFQESSSRSSRSSPQTSTTMSSDSTNYVHKSTGTSVRTVSAKPEWQGHHRGKGPADRNDVPADIISRRPAHRPSVGSIIEEEEDFTPQGSQNRKVSDEKK